MGALMRARRRQGHNPCWVRAFDNDGRRGCYTSCVRPTENYLVRGPFDWLTLYSMLSSADVNELKVPLGLYPSRDEPQDEVGAS